VLSWRWILFLNLPIAALACFVTWRSVRESKGAGADEGVDVPGVATLSVGLVALLLALDQVTDWGWTDPRILALFAAFVVLLTAFALVERRAGERALVPREVMANPAFRAACLTTLFMSAVFFVVILYLPQFMQKILGYTPLQAGAGLLPLMGVFAITSFGAAPLYERVGPKVAVSLGAGLVTIGMFLISLITRDSGWAALVPGMVVTGVGIGLFYSSITTAAVTAVDPSRSSLAGGIVYMFQVAGGSVGLGLTTTVFTTASQDRLQRDAASLREAEIEEIQGVLAGTESAAEIIARQGRAAGERLIEVVRDAFVTGLNWSFRLVAVLALAGLVVAVLFVGGRLLGARGDNQI
jgi:Na+/melibiose symporter-like transporter